MPARTRRLRSMRLLIADLPAPVAQQGDAPGTRSVEKAPSPTPDLSLGRVFRPLEALGVEMKNVRTQEAFEATLRENGIDVLVLDARAFGPGGALPAAIRTQLKGRGRQAVPVMLVADPSDPIPAVVAGRALRGGQWDLVHRDAPPEEILLRVERLMDQATLLHELEEARYHASHDDRTGLLRPLRFDARLREHFSAAQRHRLELALILVDLDNFGLVNKCYDHTVGDELIARAGSVIGMSLRTEDVGARIGGDEFALILPYTQRIDAARVVTRLAGRFRALSGPPPTKGRSQHPECSDESLSISASIGFETFDGTDLRSPEELRHNAEQALRAAKEAGGNQGVYFRSLASDEDDEEPQTALPQALLQPAPRRSDLISETYAVAAGDSAHQHGANPIRSIEDEVPRGVDFENKRLDSLHD